MNPATGTQVLQRTLALFLFGGSLMFGLAIPAAVDGIFRRQAQAVGMLLAGVLTAWMLGWLGTVLWSGRSIPRWFIRGFLLLLVVTQVVCACCCDTWSEAGVILGSLIPSAMGFGAIWREYPGKPAKPLAFDEL